MHNQVVVILPGVAFHHQAAPVIRNVEKAFGIFRNMKGQDIPTEEHEAAKTPSENGVTCTFCDSPYLIATNNIHDIGLVICDETWWSCTCVPLPRPGYGYLIEIPHILVARQPFSNITLECSDYYHLAAVIDNKSSEKNPFDVQRLALSLLAFHEAQKTMLAHCTDEPSARRYVVPADYQAALIKVIQRMGPQEPVEERQNLLFNRPNLSTIINIPSCKQTLV